MKVGIFFRKQIEEVIHIASEIIQFLKTNDIEVFLDSDIQHFFPEPVIEKDLLPQLDFLISIGGDGTFLRASHNVIHTSTPLIGINYGFTGFLTTIEEEEVLLSLHDLIHGKYHIEDRMTLEFEMIRNGNVCCSGYAVNDVLFQRQPMSKMISLDIFSDKQKIANFRGDGVIIATPTGSTAYSLSSGGPILDPQCSDIIINPLCPHRLSSRCLVLPDSRLISVSIHCHQRPTLFITDGFFHNTVMDKDRIQIKKSTRKLRIIHLKKKNFFDTLNQKFNWGL
ncbi:MAG: NAD(+)/NADH kinase [Caldisericia bacterium]|nr:NAD(+)/NADH kinase [Caldisericia bacterium]MDD4614284.1 NAD(+)/NADH kinase [Caldisericia bacterium]